ncbi:DUF2510 domain-containing protein [Streptomyces sp. HNM0663]|uniref:DUF2510 domain-containing protein n=1 Tax=Streptomyces chengmaiensis TaxID=3040919 RepID=A0ABT6HV99_9ACTN|nr:DUF2510 domain-containing protein [Streptomyces chengmaiensis]MDH2392636.1 DUF2510 domain-containing protein [Streptomyces chengmaiensis]
MSMTTPPGWYPDPNTPGAERWWDGVAWAAHTRAAQATPAQPAAPPTVPMHLSPPSPGGGRPGRRRGRLVAFSAAGVLLLAAAVAVVLVMARGGSEPLPGDAQAAPNAPEAAATTSPAAPETSEAAVDPESATVLEDQLNGIAIPIPDGWTKSDRSSDIGATMVTDDSYDCPAGTSSLCRHGRVTSFTADAGAKSPEEAARRDIPQAVDKAYGEEILGNQPYGGIASHAEVKAQSIAVAGRAGYLVRWRVLTEEGPGGHVQSVAFPSTVGTEAMVVVRLSFDAGPEGPPLAGMDAIVSSIRPLGGGAAKDAGVGGGITRDPRTGQS